MAAPRYEALVKLASGGMATVWIGTARGALGFRQLVAIKKPHPHMLEQEGFREELIAEARLASMIRHANVVDVRDVEEDGTSISLVMDYIEGASLGDLLVVASKKGIRIPPRVAVRIVRDACAGLHAAHELVDEKGRPVGLVHRDISPQNILVGEDGIARVTDFGVAKFSRKNMASTSAGSLKGKLAYMAPEYLRSEPIDRRCDVFATGIVLWEALTGQRCFRGENEPETFRRILEMTPPPVSACVPALAALDGVVATALEKSVTARFQNTTAMGQALEIAANEAGLLGSHTEVATTLKELLGPVLADRRERVRAKLADEPSLASMGHEAKMSPVADLAPPTEGPAPTQPVPPTQTSDFADPMARTVTTDAMVPPTVPATVPTPRGGTLGLPAVAVQPPPGFAPTLGFTPPTTPSPGQDFAQPQPVTANSYEIESTPRPPKSSLLVPLLFGGVIVAGLAIAGGITLGRSKQTPAASAPSAVASTAPVVSAPSAAPAAPAASAAVSAPEPVHSATTVATPAPRPAAKPAPKPAASPAAPAPAPAPAPSASVRRPAANPYE